MRKVYEVTNRIVTNESPAQTKDLDAVGGNGCKASTEEVVLPEPSGAPHPIVAYTRNLEDRVHELEGALVHMADFMPRHAACEECRRIHALMYPLLVDRANELEWRKAP